MKKLFAFLLALVMVFSLAACGGAPAATEEPAEEPAEGGVELPAEDVAMQYMTAEETLAILGEDGYTIIDLRKAEDYEAGHIPGSVLLSMDPAVNGDTDDGIATMKAGIEGVDDTLVLVCYSGKKYAQMGTNVLSALGYDMSKVYTLEGGFNNWIEVNPDSVEAGEGAAAEAPAEEAAEAIVVDEAAKTITVQAVATGNTESSIHMLVNEDGSNAGKAFFTSPVTTLELYDALVSLGAVPGNNVALDASTGTILGSGLDVKVTIDGQDYGCYDLIDASEPREMQARFGGNIELNLEYATGCLLCLESCSLGITSDAAYAYTEPMEFIPSDAMPEAGTAVTFTFTVDDTAMVVNEDAGTITMNALSTGYAESTIHAIVNEDGSNADKTLFTTAALSKDFYDALKQLGAVDGNNIALEDDDGIIEGTGLDVMVQIGGESCSFADLFTASEPAAS